MEIAKWILIGIYILVAVILIILTLIQTKEGKQKKWTIILSIIFAILTIVLGIIYMA